MASERQRGEEKEALQVRELLNNLDSRLQLLEERLDFTERLLAPGHRTSDGEGTSRDP
jgi:hypothetical protein